MAELTLDQVRDAIAEAQGWFRSSFGLWLHAKWTLGFPTDHPIPLTLDSAAACLPEGWDWHVSKGNDVNHNFSAEAFSEGLPMKHVFVENQPTELEARFRLALACIKAGKDSHAKT